MENKGTFRDAVQLLEAYKSRLGMDKELTKDELSKLRVAFRAGKIKITESFNPKAGAVDPSDERNFRKILNEYRQFKADTEKTSLDETRITLKERKTLRKEFLYPTSDGEIPPKKDGQTILQEYREYKAKNEGTALDKTEVTDKEQEFLKENLPKVGKPDPKPQGQRKRPERRRSVQLDEAEVQKQYDKLFNEFVEYKKKTLDESAPFVSIKERIKLRSAIRGRLYETALAEKGKRDPTTRTLQENQENFDLKDIAHKLQETRLAIRKAKTALREGDIPNAADATMDAGAAINGIDNTVEAIGGVDSGQIPETIMSKIQSLKTTIDDLATEVGIQSPIDMGADPAAGVPADPNAAAPVSTPDPNGNGAGAGINSPNPQMFEASQKAKADDKAASIARIEERIKARNEKIAKALNESAIGEAALKQAVQYAPVDKTRRTSPANAPSQGAGEGTVAKATAGTEKGVIRWPNEPVSEVKPGKKVGNIEESTAVENNSEKTAKIEESLDEKHVTRELEKKRLNWKDLFKSGLLG